MAAFIPGLQLSRRFYVEALRPILTARFPSLPHSAALLGRGSEVLGYDDEMSTDHDWKPRVHLFLTEEDEIQHGASVRAALAEELPSTFAGRPVDHELQTVREYFRQHLALDVGRDIQAFDWLTLPEHGLRTFVSGAVFHDDAGLGEVRSRLAYYPRDIWLYLLITGWWRVHPEMNLVGRAGAVGDDLGSSLIASRLVADLMRLCFLMERQYAPYAKWFGTAFSRLSCGAELTPVFQRVGRSETWQDREAALLVAYERLAELHNELGLTDQVTVQVQRLWNRPFEVAWAPIPDMLLPLIKDPDVMAIADRWPVGPIDQFRELVCAPRHRLALLRVLDETG